MEFKFNLYSIYVYLYINYILFHELISMKVDFLGFIFYEKSPRYALNNLALKEIAELPHFKKVGVFVNESVKGILEITSEAQLDFIQLHGDEDETIISLLKS